MLSSQPLPRENSISVLSKRTALEHFIKKLKEDQPEEHQETKKELIKQLNHLLRHQLPKPLSAVKPSEEITEEKALENLRNYLRDEIIEKENEKPNSGALCKQAFEIQLMLAKHWPVNIFDIEEQAYLDPITLDPITHLDEALPLSSGHLILKSTLNTFYARREAYVIRNRVEWRHPVVGSLFLSQLEINDLENQEGLRFNPPRVYEGRAPFPAPLAQRPPEPPAPVYNSFRQQFREQRDFSLSNNAFISFLKRRYHHPRRTPSSPSRNEFISFIALLFAAVGMQIIISALAIGIIASLSILNPALPLAAMLVFSLVSGVSAAYRAEPRERAKKFMEGFGTGLISCAIILSCGFLGQAIIAALGAASVITAASMSTAMAVWAIIHPLLPLLGLGAGLIAAKIRREPVSQIFSKINMVILWAPAAAFGFIFGETARLFSRAAYALGYAFKIIERPIEPRGPAPNPAPAPQNALSLNSRIHRFLGADRAASVPVDPRQINPSQIDLSQPEAVSAPQPRQPLVPVNVEDNLPLWRPSPH